MRRRVDVKDSAGNVLYHYFIQSKNKETMANLCSEYNAVNSSGYYRDLAHEPVIGSEFELAEEAYKKIVGEIDE